MVEAIPLQVLDNFLLQYNVGQVLALAFVLGALATIPLKSLRILALHVLGFGLLFALTPASVLGTAPEIFRILGVALAMLGPVLYVSSSR
jgi:hypothetical protein